MYFDLYESLVNLCEDNMFSLDDSWTTIDRDGKALCTFNLLPYQELDAEATHEKILSFVEFGMMVSIKRTHILAGIIEYPTDPTPAERIFIAKYRKD